MLTFASVVYASEENKGGATQWNFGWLQNLWSTLTLQNYEHPQATEFKNYLKAQIAAYPKGQIAHKNIENYEQDINHLKIASYNPNALQRVVISEDALNDFSKPLQGQTPHISKVQYEQGVIHNNYEKQLDTFTHEYKPKNAQIGAWLWRSTVVGAGVTGTLFVNDRFHPDLCLKAWALTATCGLASVLFKRAVLQDFKKAQNTTITFVAEDLKKDTK